MNPMIPKTDVLKKLIVTCENNFGLAESRLIEVVMPLKDFASEAISPFQKGTVPDGIQSLVDGLVLHAIHAMQTTLKHQAFNVRRVLEIGILASEASSTVPMTEAVNEALNKFQSERLFDGVDFAASLKRLEQLMVVLEIEETKIKLSQLESKKLALHPELAQEVESKLATRGLNSQRFDVLSNTLIQACSLPQRVRNVLVNSGGVRTVGELLKLSRKDVLKIHFMGKGHLAVIEEFLAQMGKKLKDE